MERQLELVEAVANSQMRLLAMLENPVMVAALAVSAERQTHDPPPSTAGNGSRSVEAPPNRIVDRDTEYARDTHPALFKVVDLLKHDEQARTLSVRQLAQQTGVSKSWCAIAKRYVLREESVH
jgi:hypothetical protein